MFSIYVESLIMTSDRQPNSDKTQQTSLDSESRATEETIVWNCFDPNAELEISERDRPHWNQSGALTFATIRLIDSMPKKVIERWIAEQRAWLVAQGFPDIDLDSFLLRRDLPRNLKRAFAKFRNRLWNEDLDRCHGSCLLKDPRNARIVAESLLKFDQHRYDLERFVVMPNHVHLLVQMHAEWDLRQQCESWSRFTARAIHARMKSSGSFWAEPFDHIVRDEVQFEYLRQYIVDNPKKAGLLPGEYLLWVRGIGFLSSHDSPSRDSCL